MRGIERLPEAIHSSVRSGVVISDLTRIVEELVFNSLDAGATEVSVSVGLGSSYLKVVDNGSGIPRDGLVLLGERYVTSKVDHLALVDTGTGNFDFHGEALCSISDVSLLEIVTKTRGKPNGYRKIMKKRKCLFLGINDDRQDAGTTVIVHDIFYEQPVRRKHMQSSPKKVLDSIKMSVLRIALVHFNVTFKVLDVESLTELLHTGSSSSPLPLLSSHFGIDTSASLHNLLLSDGELKLSGYISDPREIFSLKAIQYVYINSRFIYKGPIHKLVNQLAARFDLLSSWKLASGPQSEKRNRNDMCPAFILNLQCPRSYYDIVTSERSRTSVEFKDWAPVLALIENGVMRLWTKHIPHDTLETGKKRCRKQNSQTPLGLGSPQLKKLCKNHDCMETFEDFVFTSRKPLREVSEFKKHQKRAALLETDYLGPACDGSHASYIGVGENAIKNHLSPCGLSSPVHVAYPYGRKEDGISSSASGKILPAYDVKIDALPLVSGVFVDCLDFGEDIRINQGQNKSFLRSCSFESSLLRERKSPARDERFEFGCDDLEIRKRWIHCCDIMEDEVDLATCGPDLETDAAPPFQYSPVTQYGMHGILEFPGRDSTESSLLPRNILPDPTDVWESTSCCSPFRSGWSTLTAKETIRSKSFEDADDDDVDAIYKKAVEVCLEFGKDTVHGYSAKRGVRECSPENTKSSWLQQSGSFMNFSPDYKRKIGEIRRGDCEDMFSPKPLRRFTETAWSPLAWCGEGSPKNYSVASLYDSSPLEDGHGRRDSRNQVRMLNRKNRSLRSHSAPPSYKGKKRYLDLADSSTTYSARGDFQNILLERSSTESSHSSHGQRHEDMNIKCSRKTFGQYPLSRMERPIADCAVAERSDLKITPETNGIQNVGPEQNEKLINMNSVKCPDLKHHQDSFDSGWKWRNCSLPTAVESGSDIKFNQDAILDISSDILHLDGDSLVPKSIERACLEGAQVLNQVDKKFIAIVAGKTLAIIDQHAADERIRVEELRHKVLSGEMKTIKYLDAEHELVLPEVGYQLLHNYADQIQTWGWICTIHSPDTSSFSKHLDFLHRQPTVVKLLAVPCILGVDLNDIDLLEFLQQLADTDGSSSVPPSVHRILNNKACRGAIMFGDTLLPSECSLIVEELKQTSLCFQCAHGRPTTVPLVKLALLHNKIARLGSDKSWHGLSQHKLNLKRTSQRLRSALS